MRVPLKKILLTSFFLLFMIGNGAPGSAQEDLSCQQLLDAGYIDECDDSGAEEADPSTELAGEGVGESDSSASQASILTSCSCDSGIEVCTHSLIGFQTNSFIHPAEESFSRQVVRALDLTSGSNVLEFEITGTSDGQGATLGIYGWPKVVAYQKSCAKRNIGRFSETDLAEIRACVVRQRIEDLLGSYIGDLLQNGQFGLIPYDYPNNKSFIGRAYRKVDVKYKLIGVCNG